MFTVFAHAHLCCWARGPGTLPSRGRRVFEGRYIVAECAAHPHMRTPAFNMSLYLHVYSVILMSKEAETDMSFLSPEVLFI